jgi:hypothetical protein
LSTRKPVRYRDAGVDIDAVDRAVFDIKKLARNTFLWLPRPRRPAFDKPSRPLLATAERQFRSIHRERFTC